MTDNGKHWYLQLIDDIRVRPDREEKMKELHHKIAHSLHEMEEDNVEDGLMVRADMESVLHGYHLNQILYDMGASTIINQDNSKNAHWSVEDIYDTADIDFKTKMYNKYDLAWMVNWYYSDFAKVLGDNPATYIDMAVSALEDKDYYGKACERAYHNVTERLERYKNYTHK